MSEIRICKYCGMELLEDVPHGLRNCHLHAVARIAELEAENDRLQGAWFKDETICPDGSLKPKVSTLLSRIAELEAEKDIRKDQLREVKNILIDKNLHIDSLYEEGYKLQQRIAELEAENIRLGIEYQRMRLALGDIAINSKRALSESPTDQLTARWRQERQDDKWIPEVQE